ncbi:MAG: hypothetical protein EBX70_09290, partial [Betaproteobacteria bacterium]|nr:hypothetical protein [Betaproteobacteria bacterium]
MKKTLLAILMALAFPVMAQTTVSAPTPVAPTDPTVGVMATTATALTQSATNRVFIDQDGERPNVSITQTGSGNTAGSDSAYSKVITGIVDRLNAGGVRQYTVNSAVYLRGDDHNIILNQVGNNNTIAMKAVSPDVAAQGVDVTIQQLGNSNFADVLCGTGSSSAGAALTGCKLAEINWKFTGNSNAIQFRGTGDELNSQITVSGNSNEFNIDAVGNKHNQTIKVAGDFNVFNLSQTATSTYGSSVWMDVTGSSNKFAISQAGSQDNVVKITTVG